MWRVTRLVCVTLVFAVLLAPMAGAGGTSDGGRVSPVLGRDRRVTGPAGVADEYSPALSWNPTAGEYLVVWRDNRNDATFGSDIYGRRVGADGVPVGTDRRVSGPGAIADEHVPAVAWNQTANEWLVVWSDSRNWGTRGSDIYGRRVGAAGTPIGGDFGISGVAATGGENSPAVAWNGTANEYLVVWGDSRGDSIYGRRLGAAGTPIGGDFRISGVAATGGENSPAVAWNGTANEFLVVWEDNRSAATRAEDIYGRLVGADGVPVGGDFRISGPRATGSDWLPALVWNQTANEFLVVWMDGRSGWTIRGRLVGAEGVPVGGGFRISGLTATAGVYVPAVAWNQTTKRYFVVWEDWRNGPTRGSDIYGRLLGADGLRLGFSFRISGRRATAPESSPAVAWNSAASEFLVVWADERNLATRGADIYGRRVGG